MDFPKFCKLQEEAIWLTAFNEIFKLSQHLDPFVQENYLYEHSSGIKLLTITHKLYTKVFMIKSFKFQVAIQIKKMNLIYKKFKFHFCLGSEKL